MRPFEDSSANRLALARARGTIGEHRAAFDALAAGALRAEDPVEAAALARMAFTYGMFNHPGVLASAPLERMLHELGRAHVPGGVASATPRPGAPERVLHVATVVYETGGHGRVLERWLERDVARTPTVLLLKDDEPVPASLTRAVAEAGGTFAPSLPAGDLFARARALRALATRHDLVVLHVSNHEVVVPLAFADPAGRPPTLLFNHSSHLLWTGVGCSDVVASFNAFDREETIVRRGVPTERTVLLPLPIAPRTLPTREAAREALGLDPDAPVLLTVASAYKLRPVLAPSYADLASAVLDANPQATLLLVGPRPGEEGVPVHPRVRAFGPLPDIAAQLAAADLLLDSWPLTGGTTVTDAAAVGLPVLALGDPPVPLVGPRLDELGGAIACARDVPTLVARAAELLGDHESRHALAARARAFVTERNDTGWSDAMEAAIAAARAHAGEAAPPLAAARAHAGDAAPPPIAAARAYAGKAAPSLAAAPAHAGEAAPPPIRAAPPAEIAEARVSDPECVIQLVRQGHDQPCALRDAYAWNAPELPPGRRPRTVQELDERCADLLAATPTPARALAAPAIEAEAIERVLAEARRLVAAGTVASCALVVPPARVDEAVALIEAALASSPEDLDVELIAGEDAATLAGLQDVLLSGERTAMPAQPATSC